MLGRRLLCLLLVALALVPLPAGAMDPASTGVVVLHGKWGDPSGVKPVGDALTAAGFTVDRPAMAWAGYRAYDKPYEAAIDEIAEAANRLKAMGAKRIVVIGHSLGGNGALHLATRDGSLAAVVLIAPAHYPEGRRALDEAADSVIKAREMVAAGQGQEMGSFMDLNSDNRSRSMRMPAATYLSYNDPKGPAAMSGFAAMVKPVPMVWIAPSADPTSELFGRLVVPRLPPEVRLERIDIPADHMQAPRVAARAIVEWLTAQ